MKSYTALLVIIAGIGFGSASGSIWMHGSKLGLIAPIYPEGKPPDSLQVILGEALFNDKALSSDFSISCASCHLASDGFSDTDAFSRGVAGMIGIRHAPSILNTAYFDNLGWAGQFSSLESQALGAITGDTEMALPADSIMHRVKPFEARLIASFGSFSIKSVLSAIAEYERSLVYGNSAFDQWLYGNNKSALSASAIRGFRLFIGEARCSECHSIRCEECHPFGGHSALLLDNRYHNIGIGYKNGMTEDSGRFEVTHNPQDIGAFKTPCLRNVALREPYMHDGSLKTLKEVVHYYNTGGNRNPNIDPELRRLNLTDNQENDIVSFLQALTSLNLKGK